MFLKKNAIKHVVFALFDRIKGIGGRNTLYNIIREDRLGADEMNGTYRTNGTNREGDWE